METDLLTAFADPEKIKEFTTNQRLWAGLITTILGMGITFVILIVLQFVIGLFEKLSGLEKKPPAAAKLSPAPAAKTVAAKPAEQTTDELAPVIAASVAMLLGTSAGNIVIRNIKPVENTLPAWQGAGIAEQMRNRA